MANVRWRGGAPATPQVTTLTLANSASDDGSVTVTINDRAVTVAFGATATAAAVAADLAAALAVDTPEFAEVSWAADDAGVVTATGPADGTPVALAADVTADCGVTVTTATPAAGTGPADLANVLNWSGLALPATGDAVSIDATDAPVRDGLTALSGVSPATLYLAGSIGRPEKNPNSYWEYRSRYLAVGGNPVVTAAAGGGAMFVAVGTGTCVVNATADGTGGSGIGSGGGTSGVALHLTNGGTGNTLNVTGGTVGAADEPGTTCGFSAVRVESAGGGGGGGPAVTLGAGCTAGTVTQDAGAVTANCNVTAVAQTGGEYTQAAGTLGTWTGDGGTCVYLSAGTLTTATGRADGAVLDFGRDPRPRTVTTASLTAGAKVLDPLKTVTFTNPTTFDAKSLAASSLGARMTLVRA